MLKVLPISSTALGTMAGEDSGRDSMCAAVCKAAGSDYSEREGDVCTCLAPTTEGE